MTAQLHDIRFPTAISRRATGGPERRTEIVTLGSGREERNTRWADSRRRYNAGFGIKTLNEIHEAVAFFEGRRGRLHGFRWKDHADDRSGPPQSEITAFDVGLATGDGVTDTFQLVKTYGSGANAYVREIRLPVAGTVRVGVDGTELSEGTDFTADPLTGLVTFQPAAIPAAGAAITVGFEFDVPVRFDTDRLEISLAGFNAGDIPDIPIVEIRL